MHSDLNHPMRLNNYDRQLQEEIKLTCCADVELCMECGKCTGGCSNAHIFDYTPRKIIQLIKMGAQETLLNMDSLWICVACHLCVDRCPSGINIPRIMDYLREKAYHQGIPNRRDKVRLFHELMLDSIRKTGKVSEAQLIIRYNLATRQYFNNADLAPRMLIKGKLRPFPVKVKKIKEVRRMFTKTPVSKER